MASLEGIKCIEVTDKIGKIDNENTDMMSELKWTGPAVYIRNEIINLNSG